MNEIEDKHAAETEIKNLVASFESGFGKVDEFNGGDTVNITSLNSAPIGSRILQYVVVKGFGDSAEEAISEWKTELAKQPRTGRLLFWRVRPEIRWERDFRTKRAYWGIYSRFAVDPS